MTPSAHPPSVNTPANAGGEHHQRRLSGFTDRPDGDGQFTLAEFDGLADRVAEHEPSARIQKEYIEAIGEELSTLEQISETEPPDVAEHWDTCSPDAKLMLLCLRLKDVQESVAERYLEEKDHRPPAPEQWYR